MKDLPVTLLCGEVQKCSFIFKNTGQIPLKNLYLISNKLDYFSFGENIDKCYALEGNFINTINKPKTKDIIQIPLDENILVSNNEIEIPVNIYGLDNSGVHELDLLFYYEPLETIKGVPYRLLQQMIRIQTLNTLQVATSWRDTSANIFLKDNSL